MSGRDEVAAHEPGDGRTKLRRLFALAGSIGEALTIELAVRDWARRDKAVAKRLRRVDNRRMDYMRPLFAEFCADEDDAEARTFLAFSLFVGSNFVAAEGGLVVSEIWDSREQMDAFGEKLMPVLGEVGIEMAGEPEIFEVHNIQKR